jgi:hypothetical protein
MQLIFSLKYTYNKQTYSTTDILQDQNKIWEIL